jgi:hypothetical protein
VTLEGALGLELFPAWIDIGAGKYADDLGINVYGLMVCTAGYLIGAVIGPALGGRGRGTVGYRPGSRQ